ncbi:hypothetical protein FHS26_005541 [Rhizobium pisi]|uniref:Uncharacterized protein n=1 Tax=Rhizobium pisi TaxID=574561 RepID=A0A7W5BTI5_9HYPH|nr:hypothetical protein [Rhizobium pisi]MBB3137773.1 hypothetical protein [Rhizobium pisi]
MSARRDLGLNDLVKFWQLITCYRHRSELWALRLAMQVPFLAMLPIAFIVIFWWCIAPLPVVLPIILLLENLGQFGGIVLAILAMPALLVLVLVAPWFFGWYGIAASLMFGRSTAARAREKALAEAIQGYRAKTVAAGSV